MAFSGVGFCMMFIRPFKTAGVDWMIKSLLEAPAVPAAVARTILWLSSSDSAANALEARDMMMVGSVSEDNWLREAETVFASLAKLVVANSTLGAIGVMLWVPAAGGTAAPVAPAVIG